MVSSQCTATEKARR